MRRESVKNSNKSGHERGEDERPGGGECRQEVKLVFALNAPKILQDLLYFFPIAEICCQEGSYRTDLVSIIPFLPEKLSEEKNKGGTVNCRRLYTGITVTCCSRPVQTRFSACWGQFAGIWRRVGSDYRAGYDTPLTELTIYWSLNWSGCWISLACISYSIHLSTHVWF